MIAREGRSRPGTRTGRLLERERELETLAAAITAAVDGTAGLVLVEGPAGIGKSRLLGEARMLGVERELSVCSGRGGELERDFPFGVVRQLFESRLVDDSERSRLLAGAAKAAAPVFGDHGAVEVGEPVREGTFAVLHGLYWLTINLCSERALVLAVDDLHWCDRASLRFLAYLARRLEDLPIVLVASLRSSAPEADQAILQELTSDPYAQVIVPGPLSAAAVEEVVRDRLGRASSQPSPKRVIRRPTAIRCLLSELLKTLDADRVPPDAAHVDAVAELGPRAASRAVVLRLARLSADAVQVARAISALGDGAELPWSRSSPTSRHRRWLPRRGSSCAPRSCDPSRRSASCIRGAGRRLSRSRTRRARALPRARRYRPHRARAAAKEQIAAHLLVMPAARRGVGG